MNLSVKKSKCRKDRTKLLQKYGLSWDCCLKKLTVEKPCMDLSETYKILTLPSFHFARSRLWNKQNFELRWYSQRERCQARARKMVFFHKIWSWECRNDAACCLMSLSESHESDVERFDLALLISALNTENITFTSKCFKVKLWKNETITHFCLI